MSSDYQTQDADEESSGGGIAITDVYFVLFRRKWLVVAGLALGVVAACGLWKLRQPLFKSEAKLLVKYIADTPVIVAPGTPLTFQNPDESGAGIMNSEIEILQSVDNLQHVARTIGPGRILPKGADTNDVDRAAGAIGKKLKAVPLQRSKIILLGFEHGDPGVVQQALKEVINAYLQKHNETYRASGISDADLLRQRDELRTNLVAIGGRLKELKEQAGVHSLEEAKKEKTKFENNIRQELFATEADLAQQRAARDALQQNAASGQPIVVGDAVPPERIDEYRTLVGQIDALNRKLNEMSGLTDAAPLKATNLFMLQQARVKKISLETNWPGLLRLTTGPTLPVPMALIPSTIPGNDLPSQERLVRALESKTVTLSNQLQLIQAELKKIDAVETETAELERRRADVEKAMAFVEQNLTQAKFNANLGDRRDTSISRIQEPSPPYQDYGKLYKSMVMAIAGGLIGGLVLAFLVELVLDRSIRRPKDIEGLLKLPLFLSIPVLKMRSNRLLLAMNGTSSHQTDPNATSERAGKPTPSNEVVLPQPPEQEGEMKSYHDALRDRLVTYFDVRDMTHKPKLIAVTGCSPGSGVSSVATGLAASLSETGDGNVLLVDMKGQKGAAHGFFQGKPSVGLADALESETRNNAQVDQNLYVVAAGSVDQKLQRIIPQQFSQFVPKLKASDYDYIIFDMPPVAQTSITAKVARFMDMVLMVVESEKTDRDLARRATSLLTESKASVAAVLNKRRRYVPTWLLEEFH
jgi:Mrp family chromosome partitioning ATPase/uncharacterized protein involved in exopolysaccharide biosynthesis